MEKKQNLIVSWRLLLIIAGAMAVYLPSLGNFFSADDWFHLRVVQISNVNEFLNFFSFSPTPQSISFYRPLSTQVFFWLGYQLSGLNPIPGHLISLFVFGYTLLLVYWIIELLTNKHVAFWVTCFYGFSVTNFTKLYFLSTFQELLMTMFILLAVLSHLKGNLLRTIFFFILALLSKETAIVLPVLLVGIDWYRHRFRFQSYLPFFLVAIGYGYLRLVIFKPLEGDSYVGSFSLKKNLNTLFWYGLWALGAPEFLVDYVGSGLRIIPKFWSDFGKWSWWMLGSVGATIVLLAGLGLNYLSKAKEKRQLLKMGGLALGWFVVCLLPVLWLPWHKFTLELTLPMVGFSLGLAWLVMGKNNRPGMWSRIFVVSWLGLNLSMNYLTYTHHYSVNRAKVSQKVANFLQTNYPQYPAGSYFEFVNDTDDFGQSWGSSKQIAQAISYADMFRVIYQNPTIQVYYEDFPDQPRPEGKQRIPLSTRQFVE